MSKPFLWLAILIPLVAFLGTGCEDDDIDHQPPPGKGSLAVENQTGWTLDVFVDGTPVERVRPWRTRIVDLSPGVHRLVVRERDERRMWAGDADILEGRLTIAYVRVAADGWGLQVIWTLQ